MILNFKEDIFSKLKFVHNNSYIITASVV